MASMIYFENCLLFNTSYTDVFELKHNISTQYGIPVEDLYVTLDGKLVYDDCILRNSENVVRVRSRIVGGKGGFGSMLRAIGAQIEKTTNREACRDLSGRRLRDINEEKRLRKWLEGQEDREREAAERKQKKLERLIAEPKIDVNLHPQYEKERQELPERVSAAVDAGWQAAGTSKEGVKRKAEVEQSKGKKKAKLWIDAELSDCSSLSDYEEEEIKSNTAQTVSTDSGNESDKCSGSSKI
ncbi:replication stress response regulator SDE2 [Maniola jurtina]|uniref:replication stress response regulator SDE2 n=1 Tax=Maniola jurtina TaxID=191418 RepID=UPI001E68ECC0|nr:replication stress response regulator SDE2 [Maniola jurtina]